AGSLMGSWMNDSGFWIFTKMGGLTEAESLKSWTVLLAILSVISMVTTVILAIAVPMA
ncbi:MAG: gluconate permease, partial [Planctomycetaceae bacterium]|nr:gluconate permease [Planctomycetaceae bacterium]